MSSPQELNHHQTKAFRLLRLLELLQQKPWRPVELRAELELGERAIFDYLKEVEALAQQLGLRFIHDKLRSTYAIEVEERLSLTETVVAFTALRMLAHHSPGSNKAYQEALRKLAKNLPEPLKAIALKSTEVLQERPPSLSGANLETLTQGWLLRRAVAFEYRLPAGRSIGVELETYFIEVSRANMAVYVIGRDRLYGRGIHYLENLRTYKLERIQRPRLLDDTYLIPDDFDPTAYLSTAWGIVGGDPLRVLLRFSPEASERLREGGYPNLQILEQLEAHSTDAEATEETPGHQLGEAPRKQRLEGGYTLAQITVGTNTAGFPLELLPWIQSWGPRVEVLEPERLRRKWLEEARALLLLYDPEKGGNPPASEQYWAHTPRKDDPAQQWQPLRGHLEAVAKLARDFARHFKIPDAENLAFWAGLLHDLGKYSQEFQDYLKAAYKAERFRAAPPKGKVDHSSAGAVLGRQLYLVDGDELLPSNGLGSEIAWSVAAHHAGLADRVSLEARLQEKQHLPAIVQAHERAQTELAEHLDGDGPISANLEPSSREFFIRMLLSALVDADRLDTERFWSPERFAQRQARKDSLETLLGKVKTAQESIKKTDTAVNQARWNIYQAALEAARLEPGFFRLTVPTGGGKTRTSLAFALEHAVKHGKRRVVYAIPFTSIIDQSADVFAELLGAENVLEHHSAFEGEDSEEESRTRLAVENWDMPVVVTTNVQLFESLYANQPSKLRKIHNLANSVLVLDEVQTLPANLLQPTLDALRELVQHYGVTVVLCTATQPALDAPLGFVTLENVREIVPQPEKYFEQLKRVEYKVDLVPKSWEALAAELLQFEQVLCIVNTKKQAQELFQTLNDSEAFHLSTNLYPAHRREVLKAIRDRLNGGQPCRVISTQLVEAGVDLDFPVVYRALGPLDSIVQAAGRCNREGKLERECRPALGQTIIFRPEKESLPQGAYASATRLSSNHLCQGSDLHNPQVFTRYFTELYRDLVETDAKAIQALRSDFNYPEVARRYRLIEDNTFPVLVRKRPQDVAAIKDILGQYSGFAALRKLQPYIVNVYINKKEALMPFIRQMSELEVELWEWTGSYDEQMGIVELFDAGESVV